MLVFPNAKINIGLYIIAKRGDGFHDIASVFYPLPLCDALEVVPGHNFSLQLSGLRLPDTPSMNLCEKAFQLLKQDFPEKLPNVSMYLHKAIPTGAGLGGGSADAAFTLQLLNDKYRLALSSAQLAGYALQLGSDCPFFLFDKPCVATGRGEFLSPVSLDLSDYYILLVHPGIHVDTAWAYRQVTPEITSVDLPKIPEIPISDWKKNLRNDFEDAVFLQYPDIGLIKQKLYDMGAVYASMSGSGSAVYGIFEKNVDNLPFDFPKEYFVYRSKLSGQS